MLEWVAIPFSRGFSQPRDWTQVSHNVGGFFTSWATEKPYICIYSVCVCMHTRVHWIIITTISLVEIFHHTQNYTFFFFLVMRTFTIYCLNNFQLYNIVLITVSPLPGKYIQYSIVKYSHHGSDGKESACNAGALGSIPGSGISSEEGNGNVLQHSCLENSMDRRAWWTTVYRVEKSWTPLSG